MSPPQSAGATAPARATTVGAMSKRLTGREKVPDAIPGPLMTNGTWVVCSHSADFRKWKRSPR